MIDPNGYLTWKHHRVRCALGKGGLSSTKVEGDGVTPIGSWPLRRVFYRADRIDMPTTGLCVRAITQNDGWCDDAVDTLYNQLVTLPYPAHHENLWRDDGVYDLVVELGYNDNPPISGKGSAIFMHIARPKFEPTEGCVAITLDHLQSLLSDCNEGDRMVVPPINPQV